MCWGPQCPGPRLCPVVLSKAGLLGGNWEAASKFPGVRRAGGCRAGRGLCLAAEEVRATVRGESPWRGALGRSYHALPYPLEKVPELVVVVVCGPHRRSPGGGGVPAHQQPHLGFEGDDGFSPPVTGSPRLTWFQHRAE